jgi:hypothetical protein
LGCVVGVPAVGLGGRLTIAIPLIGLIRDQTAQKVGRPICNMKLSEIENLNSEKITPAFFRSSIGDEIKTYKGKINKSGASAPIILEEDLKNLTINEQAVVFLCSAFLEKKLDEWEINYVAEALLLSQKVSVANERVEDALMALIDAEYFRHVNRAYFESVVKALS